MGQREVLTVHAFFRPVMTANDEKTNEMIKLFPYSHKGEVSAKYLER